MKKTIIKLRLPRAAYVVGSLTVAVLATGAPHKW